MECEGDGDDWFRPPARLYFSTKYLDRHPRRVLNRVEREKAIAVITRAGRPAFVVMSHSFYRRLTDYSLAMPGSTVEGCVR